jgi:hypothetical protein
MTARMRTGLGLALGLASLVGGCSSDSVDPYAPQTLSFGPVAIDADSEDTSKCVALTLHNADPLFVKQVELTTGPGFHHSNWLFVPEHSFPGPDGIFTCDDRNYDQVAAGILGGVFFAQSTQSTHEVQTFPEGVALKLPAKSKLVASIHLLNTGDEPLSLDPTIAFTPMPAADVTTEMRSFAFEYHTLALPPRRQSRFSVECDIATRHIEAFGRPPDFKIYYALAHYHEWATSLTIDALRVDGSATTIYSTANNVGDTLGGTLDPPFDMTGFSKVRLSCDFYNNTDATIYYGNGMGEMCIFNAFTDSLHTWAGGALDNGDPGQPTDVNGVMSFTRNCQVYSVDGTR